MNDDKILSIKNVSVDFDGYQALTDVNIKVKRHGIHFFIGPNGAGKTTLLDIICGKTRATKGTVHYYAQGKEMVRLTSIKEYKIVRLGVVRKFQVPSVYKNLSVFDNMELSLKGGKGVLSSVFYKMSRDEKDLIEKNLEIVGLQDKQAMTAGTLAHGQKQWLEIAMQLVQTPELIMLDEPAAGMGKKETYQTGEILQQIKKDCTIIVVEHDMDFVRRFADKVTVLHEGKVLMEGNIEDALADPTVQEVYLGRGGEKRATA